MSILMQVFHILEALNCSNLGYRKRPGLNLNLTQCYVGIILFIYLEPQKLKLDWSPGNRSALFQQKQRILGRSNNGQIDIQRSVTKIASAVWACMGRTDRERKLFWKLSENFSENSLSVQILDLFSCIYFLSKRTRR